MVVIIYTAQSLILGVIVVSSAGMKWTAADKLLPACGISSHVFLLFTGRAARYGADQLAGTAGSSVFIVSVFKITHFAVTIIILLVTLNVKLYNDIDLHTDLIWLMPCHSQWNIGTDHLAPASCLLLLFHCLTGVHKSCCLHLFLLSRF